MLFCVMDDLQNMALWNCWTVGLLDCKQIKIFEDLYLSVNSVKSVKPSQMLFDIQMKSSLFHS